MYVATDATTPTERRRFETGQQRQQIQRLQQRHVYDDYDPSYNYYNSRPRSASACGFRDFVDNGDEDVGLFVQRITVTPYFY